MVANQGSQALIDADDLQALLGRWTDHPRVDLVTTDGFLLQLARVSDFIRSGRNRKCGDQRHDEHLWSAAACRRFLAGSLLPAAAASRGSCAAISSQLVKTISGSTARGLVALCVFITFSSVGWLHYYTARSREAALLDPGAPLGDRIKR